MRRWSLFIVLVMMASIFTLSVPFAPDVRAATLFVGGGGPGNYTTIQSAIANASPGDMVYVYSGTYYENVHVDRTISLKGENRDSTVIDGGGVEDVIHVSAHSSDVSGFTFTNTGLGSFRAGIELAGVHDCTITGNIITDTRTGIYLDNSNSNTIANNDIFQNRFGISLLSADGNTLEDNVIQQNAWGMRVEGSFNTLIDNHIYENEFEGIEISASTYTYLFSNVMVNDGISLWGYQLAHFNTHLIPMTNLVNGLPIYYYKDCMDLTVDNVALGQLLVVNCTDVVVRNLEVSDTDVGIALAFVDGALVENNEISDSIRGIWMQYSSEFALTDNILPGNNEGVSVWLSSDGEMSSNHISLCAWDGVDVQVSDGMDVTDNQISDCNRGIHVSQSDYLNITGNNISGSYYGGIGLYYAHFVNVTLNNVLSSGYYGVRTADSTNEIHHNNFIDNTVQARDNATTAWDDGYPSGGNYWNDYTGVDNMSGPAQNLPGSDGVGDEPYVIDADSQDNYPLMSPLPIFSTRPPGTLQASLSGLDKENVTLRWTLSPDDGSGIRSVIGYGIYRNASYDSEGLGYQVIASLPEGASKYVDILAGEGDPSGYFYRTCALLNDNSTVCAQNQAGKFTRPLAAGPDLVSIPLISIDESIGTVLQTVKHDGAWFYDPSSGEWKWHMTAKEYGGLTGINRTMGLWVNVTGDCNLTVAGIVPAQTTIHMRSGWNLVSFPSFSSSYTVADLKAELPVERVEGFDLTAPPHFLRVLQDSDVLLAGEGYWVKVSQDATWVVSNG